MNEQTNPQQRKRILMGRTRHFRAGKNHRFMEELIMGEDPGVLSCRKERVLMSQTVTVASPSNNNNSQMSLD
jgi:hypothetical protein